MERSLRNAGAEDVEVAARGGGYGGAALLERSLRNAAAELERSLRNAGAEDAEVAGEEAIRRSCVVGTVAEERCGCGNCRGGGYRGAALLER